MNTLFKLSKDALIYSTLIIAGSVFIAKKLFGRKKTNKNFYDKNKKKAVLKTKLFFRTLTRGVEIRNTSEDNSDAANNKYLKMKKFIEKISKQYQKTAIQEDKEINTEKEKIHIPTIQPSTKKDQIFYYLLNNISTMMIHTGQGN
jgi:hypothetical protein